MRSRCTGRRRSSRAPSRSDSASSRGGRGRPSLAGARSGPSGAGQPGPRIDLEQVRYVPITNHMWPGMVPRPDREVAVFKVRALNRFHGQHEGHVERGTTFETSRDRAYELAGLGVVEVLEGSDDLPAGIEQKGGEPSSSATANAPSSFSLPESRSPEQTSAPSPAGPSSASTTAGASGPAASEPTGPTTSGGNSTTKKSERKAKATDGARTAKRVGTLGSDGSNPSGPPASVANPDVSTPASSGTPGRKR